LLFSFESSNRKEQPKPAKKALTFLQLSFLGLMQL